MRSLQYCCLLIPVKNRELLQMLLKFMVRLMDNHVISLSDELPTKEMVREFIVIGGLYLLERLVILIREDERITGKLIGIGGAY